jgi:uncharacterized protein YbjT (DUF2867 family)
MKIFVTGASGFVGRAVVAELLRRHHEPVVLVRPGSQEKLRQTAQPSASAIQTISGDILKPDTYANALKGVDAVIHLIGILREFGRARFDLMHRVATEHIVRECELAGVKRYVHMSSCGVGRLSKSAYMKTKLAGEKIVRASQLNWTIFRPSVIFGRGDGFVTPFIKRFRSLPIAPLIDGGRTLFKPIAVEDVAHLFADAAERTDLAKKTFEIGGKDILSFRQIMDEIGSAMGKRILRLPVPRALLLFPALLLGRFRFFPVSRDELRMLQSDNTCDSLTYIQTFGLEPRDFREGLRALVKET